MSVEEQAEKIKQELLDRCRQCNKKHNPKICLKCEWKYLFTCLLTEREKNRELEKEIAWFKSHTVKVDEYNSAVQ